MAKIKFTFTHQDGRIETRTSERAYTHVVLQRLDLDHMRKDRTSKAWTKADREDYEYMAAQGDKYTERLGGAKSAEEYAAQRAAARLAHIDARYGNGSASPEFVAQWSMSEKNAQKAARPAPGLASVRVAPVDAK